MYMCVCAIFTVCIAFSVISLGIVTVNILNKVKKYGSLWIFFTWKFHTCIQYIGILSNPTPFGSLPNISPFKFHVLCIYKYRYRYCYLLNKSYSFAHDCGVNHWGYGQPANDFPLEKKSDSPSHIGSQLPVDLWLGVWPWESLTPLCWSL